MNYNQEKIRCKWARSELAIQYHDEEWCQITRLDDDYLFELLVLEMMQAGLSWETVLQKRAHYRIVLNDFNYRIIKNYTQHDVEHLLQDKGIIRNRLKINAIINNAKCFEKTILEFGSFINYINSFQLNISVLSKDLKKRGYKFVGETIITAYLEALGLIDSHEQYCFRSKQ